MTITADQTSSEVYWAPTWHMEETRMPKGKESGRGEFLGRVMESGMYAVAEPGQKFEIAVIGNGATQNLTASVIVNGVFVGKTYRISGEVMNTVIRNFYVKTSPNTKELSDFYFVETPPADENSSDHELLHQHGKVSALLYVPGGPLQLPHNAKLVSASTLPQATIPAATVAENPSQVSDVSTIKDALSKDAKAAGTITVKKDSKEALHHAVTVVKASCVQQCRKFRPSLPNAPHPAGPPGHVVAEIDVFLRPRSWIKAALATMTWARIEEAGAARDAYGRPEKRARVSHALQEDGIERVYGAPKQHPTIDLGSDSDDEGKAAGAIKRRTMINKAGPSQEPPATEKMMDLIKTMIETDRQRQDANQAAMIAMMGTLAEGFKAFAAAQTAQPPRAQEASGPPRPLRRSQRGQSSGANSSAPNVST